MSREMHILRAQRITTGPQIRGTHPIVVSFENYRDKVCNNRFNNDNILSDEKTKITNIFECLITTGRYFATVKIDTRQ